MVNWAQAYDCHGDVDRVPELLALVEREDDAEAWIELEHRTIGSYGRYAAIRDWDLGDTDRRDLRPSPAEQLSGVGLWMYDIAVRDEQEALAEGICHLFGKAECPRCASVFTLADEYAAANCPVLR
ncbi:hypothetical protein J3A78_007121 [Streptomyces sp. PvR006]|uniref:hypothetical protein n=1 Tax=Streptomyces sp. PvR006 TaxID=2817860 RepID=UPI001AE8484D|nr:hypothetical protein [Streptomyces sp. PvR006]MBP2586643.1 hypothetical protein [Streptomyces sp. PvR006]